MKSLIEELDHAPESVQRAVLAFLRHLRARVAAGGLTGRLRNPSPTARGTKGYPR
jgi:hypothetical protein